MLLASRFDRDRDGWVVTKDATLPAIWQSTSYGSLNRYITNPEIPPVQGSANSGRWYFDAPAKFLGDQAVMYDGTVSFVLGNFFGNFATLSRSNPLSFVTLHCDSCNNGNGITLAQRNVHWSSAVQTYSFRYITRHTQRPVSGKIRKADPPTLLSKSSG